MVYLIFFLLQLGLAAFIFFLCIAFMTGGPFVPSTNDAAEAMVKIAGIKPGDTVVDLGSGNGKILYLAAGRGARAIGYDINPFLVFFTNIKAKRLKLDSRIRAYWKNFWSADISFANVIFIYLLPWNMDRLHLNFLNSVKPGTRIVTNSFIFTKLKPAEEDHEHHVYLYIMK